MYDLSQLQAQFQDYLKNHSFTQPPVELYDPIDYVLSLGGKRIRPVLLLMGYQLFDVRLENAMPAAFAVEVFHNFSLLHDDIMDQAPLRRGKPSVHIKYNTNTGILSGDLMLIYAYRYLGDTVLKDEKAFKDIYKTFNQVATEVCEGQQYDMNFETRMDVSIDEYINMIRLKTAVLIGGALKIGALAAGSSNKDAELLYDFGVNTGIAFQLQDDILDTFGDPDKFGKKVGGDIVQNKKTFLLLKALELAKGDDHSNLVAMINDNGMEEKEKIKKVTALYNALGVRQDAEKLQAEYTDLAFEALAKVECANDRKKPLRDIATELLNREA